MDTRYLSIGETSDYLNTNRPRVVRYIKRLGIKTYPSRVDHRAKVIRMEDVRLIAEAMKGKGVGVEEGESFNETWHRSMDITRP
jgi:hypothetical protein